MEKIISLNKHNIDKEHICCAISDKKCKDSYELKKNWLKKEFENGYIFRRIDARAKVFIEYGPAEKAWAPIDAPNYIFISCFWVSGQYKRKGYGKELLKLALDDAEKQKKDGLVTIAGTKKFHFMSDTKWLLKQGFETTEQTPTGFSILTKKINSKAENPSFKQTVINCEIDNTNGLIAYHSNRCPFAEYHVTTSLTETALKRNLPLKIIKFETLEQAQSSPTPATIFSLFYDGKFITTDISVCMDSRFDKIIGKQ